MLQGRVAPPPSPAVGLATEPPRSTSLSLSRRNSFSQDVTASIAQSRASSSAGENIQLHVNDALRPLSPRKSASFSLPRTPRQDDGLGSTSAPRGVLRPTLSDFQLRRLLDDGDSTGPSTHRVSTPLDSLAARADAFPSSTKIEVSDDDTDDDDDGHEHRSPGSSATSSSNSPVEPAREDDDDAEQDSDSDAPVDLDVDDPDAFETWLQDARVLESPVKAADVSSHPLVSFGSSPGHSAALLRDRAASLELSKSVQQIEHEIRLAIDSAASRVATDAERSERFARELQELHTPTRSVAAVAEPTGPPMPSAEPELLLLMDVLIGDGRSETIEIYVGDRPVQLAEAFAAKHGLVADAIPKLTQHIEDQLAALEDDGDGEEQQERAFEEEALVVPQPTATDHQHIGQMSGEGHALDFRDDRSAFHEDFEFDDDQTSSSPPPHQEQQREHEREHSYNHLMEKYGHYTSHSNKINPTVQHHTKSSKLTLRRTENGEHDSRGTGDPLTVRHVELSEHARLMFTPRRVAFGSSTKPTHGNDKASVYNRLYSLAEAREKWIRRQQKAKAADEVRERQAMMKLEISAKSRDMVAGRGTGGYAHIGERLYDEALSDLAKKQREREKRELERATQVDWTCPKCAFVNTYGDAVCKNVVASVVPLDGASVVPSRRETLTTMAALLDAHPEVVCGYARPDELFRPTLLVAPASVVRAVHHNKTRATATAASSQRQRTQQQMEDEFRQTCPFKPKINDVSEEIMRDRLEQEAKARGTGTVGGVVVSATGGVRRKNPHQALYEDAFHARAQREAREEAHMKQFPFKPDIGVNALWSKRSGDDADADVVERLAVSKYQELERKRLSLHAKYAPDRDPVTGREYFKPETGRAPIFNRNERGLPIGDFLYEAHKEQEEYLRRLRQQDDDARRQQREQAFVSDKSKQALAMRKKKTCARLFDWLVKTQSPSPHGDLVDGRDSSAGDERRIVPAAVDASALPHELSRIVSIVFAFANQEPFTLHELELFMDKLVVEVPGLTYTQVLFLTENLRDGKSARPTSDATAVTDDAELTFRPAIDRNSDAMAKKHGRADRPSVFEALNQYYDHYKERQAQAAKQREREFARTHPFQPTFVTKDRKTKGAKFYEKLHRQDKAGPPTATKDDAPLLRTAVPNARPFVRPLGRTPSDVTLRSRASSGAGDDDDAVLTSHVLAALDDGTAATMPPPAPSQTQLSSSNSSKATSAGSSTLSALFASSTSAIGHVDRLSRADLAH